MSDNQNPLTPQEIIRAWKDEEFRNSLTSEQLAALPPAPSELAELSDAELEEVAGGLAPEDWCICTNSCSLTLQR